MLLDHRENSVFLIHNELSAMDVYTTELHPAVGDILDTERMHVLFDSFRPEIVYHAAAHKHVGLMELQPGEAVKTNIQGTRQIADLANEYGAEKFVMISTDKAVCPTSVMGCTKQIAERYVLALGSQSRTRYVVVRFGNVLGSNGSVVPLFKEQIARGGPVTITDPRMTRFFMTIPEASQLVLQAGCLGEGGEIFVLDMGEQVKILDLAKKMIQLAGLPETAIEIQVVGARPGEKLYEELYLNAETSRPTAHQKIFSANHVAYQYEDVVQCIDRLLDHSRRTPEQLKDLFSEYIPEYQWRKKASRQTQSPEAVSR
jgi:FlaA1/EpsC-like NDP-sugar epimerase